MQLEGLGRIDDLHWPALNVLEARAQNFMPLNDGADCSFQRSQIERPMQVQSICHLVGGTYETELFEEPEPLLRM
jgi:hypothetical protein